MSLIVNYCQKLTAESIRSIAANCRVLRELRVANCKFFSLPDDFGDRLQNLETLSFGNNNLTWLPRSFAKLTKLRILDLRA